MASEIASPYLSSSKNTPTKKLDSNNKTGAKQNSLTTSFMSQNILFNCYANKVLLDA